MTDSFRLLVIDEATDTGDVLKAVYEPKGGHVSCINSFRRLAENQNQDLPNVLVMHEASELAQHPDVDRQFANVPRVIIGSIQHFVPTNGESSLGNGTTMAASKRVPDPFDYRDLVNSVDALLNDVA